MNPRAGGGGLPALSLASCLTDSIDLDGRPEANTDCHSSVFLENLRFHSCEIELLLWPPGWASRFFV